MEVPTIVEALEKLDSFDADLRFMGLNDIQDFVVPVDAASQLSPRVISQIRDGVVARLNDDITEVQTQAVKTLGPVIVLLSRTDILGVINSVIALTGTDIRELALRTVISNVPRIPEVVTSLIDSVLPSICSPDFNPTVESIGVFSDLVHRFRAVFSSEQISTAQASSQEYTRSSKGLISRRSSDVLLLLVPYMNEEQWNNLVHYIAAGIKGESNGPSRVAALLLCAGLTEAAPNKVPEISGLYSAIAALTHIDIDEEDADLVEAALTAIEGLVNVDAADLSDAIQIAVSSIRYNPNYVDNGSDDEEIDDFDEEFDVSGGSDYDDDSSWKVRRYGARVAAALIKKAPAQALEDLVAVLVRALSFEKDDSVKEEILAALSLAAAGPVGLLDRHIQTLVSFAKSDASNSGYVLLLTNLTSNARLGSHSGEVALLAMNRAKHHKIKQLVLLQTLVLQMISHEHAENVGSAWPSLETIIITGLTDPEYSIQSVALNAVGQAKSFELLPRVQEIIKNGKSITIRGLALKVAAELAADAPEGSGAANSVMEQQLEVLKTDLDLRISCLQAMSQVLEKTRISEPIAVRAIDEIGELSSVNARTVTITALRALALLSRQAPTHSEKVAALVLNLADDPQFFDIKCEVLATVPNEPGVQEFALKTACEISNNQSAIVGATYNSPNLPPTRTTSSTLVQLFGSLAQKNSLAQNQALVNELEQVLNRSAYWAEIVAEVVIKGNLPNPATDDWSEWTVLIAMFLAARGRATTTAENISQLAAANSGVSNSIAGYALGAIAAVTGNTEFVFNSVQHQNSQLWLEALEAIVTISTPDELRKIQNKLDISIKQFTSTSASSETSTVALGRIIGTLVVLNSNVSILNDWITSVDGLAAGQFAFSNTEEDEVKDALISQFVTFYKSAGQAGENTYKIRQGATAALTWAIQAQPNLVESHIAEILAVFYEGAKIDESLIRTIQVGPFKHKIDDGLGLRKSAYEGLYTIISNDSGALSKSGSYAQDLLDQVISGLSDDHDIKVISSLMLNQLASSATDTVANNITAIKNEFTKITDVTVKENSVKQEHDRKAAIARNISNTSRIIKTEMVAKHFGDPGLQAFIVSATPGN